MEKRIILMTLFIIMNKKENGTYIYSLDPFLLVRFDDLKEIEQVVVEADIQYIETVKLLDYENKVSMLRTKK